MHLSNSYTVSANHGDNGQIQEKVHQTLLRQHPEEDAKAFDSDGFIKSASLPNHSSFTKKSASIPIKSTAEHEGAAEAESEADHRDYQFYSRVVSGIRNAIAEKAVLKHENQHILDNIVKTRNEDTEMESNYKYDDRAFHQEATYFESDEEGVFEMDL